jgi:hypothetical protein
VYKDTSANRFAFLKPGSTVSPNIANKYLSTLMDPTTGGTTTDFTQNDLPSATILNWVTFNSSADQWVQGRFWWFWGTTAQGDSLRSGSYGLTIKLLNQNGTQVGSPLLTVSEASFSDSDDYSVGAARIVENKQGAIALSWSATNQDCGGCDRFYGTTVVDANGNKIRNMQVAQGNPMPTAPTFPYSA